MSNGFIGLFVMLFVAGALLDNENKNLGHAMAIFWVVVLCAWAAASVV